MEENSKIFIDIIDNRYRLEPLNLNDYLENIFTDTRHVHITLANNVTARIIDTSPYPMTISCHVGQSSSCDITITLKNPTTTQKHIHVILAQPHSHASIFVAASLNNTEKLTITTLQHHNAPHTTSSCTVKAALFDSSQIDYKGLIRIERHATRSNAAQKNINLTLGPQSKASSIPSLEVLTDDVSCSHGSATGGIDESVYFYCQSRGMERGVVTKMVADGMLVI